MADSLPKELRFAASEKAHRIWGARIQNSLNSRMVHFRKWQKLREFYKGNYFDHHENSDRAVVKKHFTAVRQTLSSLYFQDPSMNFTGKTVAGKIVAKVMEQVISYERELIGTETQERDVLQNALLYGTGILKHSWNGQYGIKPAWADDKIAKKWRGNEHFESISSETFDGDVFLERGSWTEHNPSMVFGHPNTLSIHPKDFLLDADALTYDQARWAAHRFHRPFSDSIRDVRWNRKARESLQPTGQSEHFSDSFVDGFGNSLWNEDEQTEFRDDSSLVTFYEIYDKVNQLIIVISPSTSEPIPLEVKPYPYLGKDGPFEILQFFPVDDTFWAIPYSDLFTPQAMWINKLRAFMADHLMRWGVVKGVYREGSIDPNELKRLGEAITAEFVGVKQLDPDTGDINKILQILPNPPIVGDAWRLTELFSADFREVSGVSENQLGGGRGIQTATEANIIDEAGQVRTSDMRFQVDRFLRGSTRKLVSLMRQFSDGEKIFAVVGPDGVVVDQVINAQVINGEYDVDIEAGSTEKVNRNARMRQAIELAQVFVTFQPLLQQQGYAIDFSVFAKDILTNADWVKNPDRVIVPMQQLPPPTLQIPPEVLQMAMQIVQQQSQQNPQNQAQQINQLSAPAAVDGFGNVINVSPAFQQGRQLSEQAGGIL